MSLVQFRVKRTWYFDKVTSQSKVFKPIKGNLREKIVATEQVDVQGPDEILLREHL